MAHGIHKIEAEYTPYPIESYQDNPLIEALPCYLEYFLILPVVVCSYGYSPQSLADKPLF